MSEIRIEMTDHGQGRVWVDGVERTHAVSIQFKTSSGGFNEVEIVERHLPRAIVITGPGKVGGT